MTTRIPTVLILALAAALATGTLFAQTNVGVVDFDLVFRSSTRARAVFADVETFRATKASELSTRREAYQTKLRELQTNAGLSASEKDSMAQDLRAEQTRMQRLNEDAEREGQRLTNQALAILDRELGPIVREVAAEQGLQLILQNLPDSGVVFADPAIDVTAAVIAKLDAQQPPPTGN